MNDHALFQRLSDIADLLATVHYLNEAVSMAAAAPGLTRQATNAIQAVTSEIVGKLCMVQDQLEQAMRDLK